MARASAFDRFVASLDAAAPPDEWVGPVRGLWFALRGEWDRAHDAVQADTAPDAWVHAALHREEGDLANAGYWYRRAGRRQPGGELREEYLRIAESLLLDRS